MTQNSFMGWGAPHIPTRVRIARWELPPEHNGLKVPFALFGLIEFEMIWVLVIHKPPLLSDILDEPWVPAPALRPGITEHQRHLRNAFQGLPPGLPLRQSPLIHHILASVERRERLISSPE